ncbi:hypothetical protein CSB45_06210 [candidate division KSB3 bacterium]|uniref:Carbohydrate kinase FGGY C-terminal domain-containing protein n=1 Tax=candidate division KSB3 bacterium TaxID=2044937 RepID=A0A2G6E7F2_9BACT|nr:MAG: hypothetical protein CSB45_06210 [candidate division KSB3 bacterium]PIE30238.1 MAG: hypothetical protein CSA57_04925 [candidate division KSB3 bacterium]
MDRFLLTLPYVEPTGSPHFIKVVESETLGAAMLAGISTGALTNARDAAACFVKEEKRFDPNMRHHAIYQEKYRKYCGIYPAIQHLL